ncbi:MAG: hypothetical protein ACLQMF_07310 [Rectinemataceae bacterium]
MDDWTRRAIAAWYKGGGTEEPSIPASGVQEIAGLQYVILKNESSILAIYRIGNNNLLRRLRRPPKELLK